MTSAIITTDAALTPVGQLVAQFKPTAGVGKNQAVNLVYETLGEGDPLLLLPALSTVSTRGEMRGAQDWLSGIALWQ